jgi:hypothetical protein
VQAIRYAIQSLKKIDNHTNDRTEKLLRVIIIELPHKGAQIQFRIPDSGVPRTVGYLYENKEVVDNHLVKGLKRYCEKDGCCTANRTMIVFADKEDCKDFKAGIINSIGAFTKKQNFFRDATVIELRHGVQLYFSDKVSIHARRSPDDCSIIHSPASNNEFSCYPRIVTYGEGKLETSLITPVRHAP